MCSYLLITGDFTPLGGMDRANHALASYLARREGAEVHLVAHRVWDDLVVRSNVQVYRVPRLWGKHLLGAPLLARAGWRQARRLAPRGVRVVVNGGNCLWGDVNWVHYVHASWAPEADGSLPRRAKAWVARRAALADERACLPRARLVIANSERTRSEVIERLGVAPERAHTVYYGSDPARCRPPTAAERAEARDRLDWSDDRPAVAFVGALGDRRKGFDTLLDAWRRLARDPLWDARLVVIGAGAALDGWKTAAADLADSVTFLGFRADVPTLLWACDALVSPTRYEAYGLNVHEALCCGLPALVTRAAGVAERYPAELDDLLLPDPNDAADLAGRLRRWRDRLGPTQTDLVSFSERLRAYTWDRMAERFLRLTDTNGTYMALLESRLQPTSSRTDFSKRSTRLAPIQPSLLGGGSNGQRG